MDTDHHSDTTDDTPSPPNPTFIQSSKHKYWKLAASDTHQSHRFLQYLDNIKLPGDSISQLRQFYERIRLAFHSSFTKATDILPQFKDIAPNHPFGHILVPVNEFYMGYHSIHNTYNWFGTALFTGLTDTKLISPKLAPLAHRVITTERHETDGWTLLYRLICSRNPLLGGKGDDVISEITNLKITNGDDIHTFYDRVVIIQEKLEFSTEIISKTKLIEKYLHAMAKSTTHHYLLQYFIIDLNLHISRNGHDENHPTITVHTIYQHLLITNAPTQFQLTTSKKFKPNILQLITDKFSDATLQRKLDNDQIPTKETFPTNELTTYILQDDTEEKYYIQYDPTIQAFRHHSNNRPKIIYEACGISGHPVSKCFRRGFNFLPRDIQRRISAYNTKYGSTPDKDISPQSSSNTVLPAPQTKLLQDVTPSNANTDTNTNTTTLQATIHRLQHVLPTNDEEISIPVDEQIEFLDIIDMERNTPVLNIINQIPRETKTYINKSNNINPLSIDLLTSNGEVNVTDLHTLQDQLLQPTPLKYFTTHCRQHFHIDTGTNVHATTRKTDFLVYYPHKKVY